MLKLNKEILDKLENRMLEGLMGIEEIPAATLAILKSVLHDNGRLTTRVTPGDPGAILSDASEDELNGTIPFPVVRGQ